jgi:hypothetical protein
MQIQHVQTRPSLQVEHVWLLLASELSQELGVLLPEKLTLPLRERLAAITSAQLEDIMRHKQNMLAAATLAETADANSSTPSSEPFQQIGSDIPSQQATESNVCCIPCAPCMHAVISCDLPQAT